MCDIVQSVDVIRHGLIPVYYIPCLVLWAESVICECIGPLSYSKVDSGQPQVVRKGGTEEVPAERQV